MENQEVNQGQVEETSSFSFVSDEEAAQALSNETIQEAPPVEEQPVQQEAPVESEASDFDAVLGGDITEQQGQTETQVEDQYSPEEIEAAVQMYLSDRLGREISSLEDLQGGGGYEDERIQAIADFVSETGRDPSDWFAYQSLNPDQMDDTTAIQVQMATDYPNLSHQEIETLMTNKYKVDENLYTEEEVRLSKLQMKIDAENARKVVSEYREKYAAPESQSGLSEEEMAMEQQAIDDWTNQSLQGINDLRGVEFDLGNGNSFKFGLSDQYKSNLSRRSQNIDNYFDQYISEDGTFDHDTFNVHRSVVDNIDSIVQSIYKQGLADGQRGLVNQAANVRVNTPQGSVQPQEDSLTAQLREAMGGNSAWSF